MQSYPDRAKSLLYVQICCQIDVRWAFREAHLSITRGLLLIFPRSTRLKCPFSAPARFSDREPHATPRVFAILHNDRINAFFMLMSREKRFLHGVCAGLFPHHQF